MPRFARRDLNRFVSLVGVLPVGWVDGGNPTAQGLAIENVGFCFTQPNLHFYISRSIPRSHSRSVASANRSVFIARGG
jgi:hypothetical protein